MARSLTVPLIAKPADVAAGEKNRRDHERICGEGQARAVDLEDGLVVKLVEIRDWRRRDRKTFSISSAVSLPPLPWPSTICLCSKIGSGHEPKSGEGTGRTSSRRRYLCVSSFLSRPIGSCRACTGNASEQCRRLRVADAARRHSRRRRRPRLTPWSRPADVADCIACRRPGSHAAS